MFRCFIGKVKCRAIKIKALFKKRTGVVIFFVHLSDTPVLLSLCDTFNGKIKVSKFKDGDTCIFVLERRCSFIEFRDMLEQIDSEYYCARAYTNNIMAITPR